MLNLLKKETFSKRLNLALDLAGYPVKGAGRQVHLAKAFNVSQKGARKWVEGEAIPATNRLIVIASDLGVNVEWLLSGHGSMRPDSPASETVSFQDSVKPWLLACFGEAIANDKTERNHRFLEEALELVQATGCTQSEAHQLVDYVFSRPVGEPTQEAGGVMVTLAALCLAHQLDMHKAGDTELARIWVKIEQIRTKQAAKPRHSPLPA